MVKNYEDFKNSVLGKAYDIDGYFSAQCWDGAMYYSKWLGYPTFNCGLTGYAIDIWTQRKNSGILKYYDEVSDYQPGDIAVFKAVPSITPYSHIAIFDHDAGGGYGWFLGQNQGAPGGAFNLTKLPYSATTSTGFRPKCFQAKPVTIKDGGKGAVYRVYNTNSGDHLYTTSLTEAQNAVNAGWKYENVAWKAPKKGDPVYRLYNPNGGQHHYTVSLVERDALKKAGWKYEGVAFYSSGSGTIYRMYNPKGGQHLLTTSRAEHDSLVKAGWACEESRLHY